MLNVKERGLQISALIAVVLFWALVSKAIDLPNALPSPLTVFKDLWEMLLNGKIQGPLSSTLYRTAFGFIVGFAAGTVYGITAYTLPVIGDYTRGLFNLVLYSPTLIIIFLGLIMLGLSNMTVILIVGFAISTDVGVYIRDSFRNFDGELAAMAQSYKVSTLQSVKDLYIPFLIPPMLATSRIGFSLAWKVAFLCEVFGFPDGLGWEVRSSYRVYDISTLLAWLVVFIVTLLIVEQLIRSIERVVVKW